MEPTLRHNMLYQMLRIRLIEERIAERYAEQEMRCPVHLSIGQEAVAVGACLGLEPQDYVMSTHRAHAHYLAKGGDLRALVAELYGKATGCSSGKGGSMHLIDLDANFLGSTPIVGSSLPVAVGAAFGSWMTGENRVTVAFFGEGMTEEGIFSECLNFAVLKQLPMVFVCENNGYSVYSPMEVRQPPERDRLKIACGHGLKSEHGDGNDVETVYLLTRNAVRSARAGEGPWYLEFDTYRWREHCGPHYDNHLGYRTEQEFQTWRSRCPIDRYSALLMREGLVAESELLHTTRLIHEEIDEAFRYALESLYPPEEQLFTNVYAEYPEV